MSRKQDTDDPTYVRKMLDDIRFCNPSANLRNVFDIGSTALVPTRLGFDDSVILIDNKKRKLTGSNVSVSTAEVSVEDSDVSVLGKFTNSLIQWFEISPGELNQGVTRDVV
jgi:hypothetical protein